MTLNPTRATPYRHPAFLALCLAALACAGVRPSAAGGQVLHESEDGVRVYRAGANSDTLDYAWEDVLPVAIDELRRNDWEIASADTTERRIVTRWKPLKHIIARIFLGRVMARCVVDLAPLGSNRTAVTIQGGLASADDLEANPGFGPAQDAYAHAAERWLGRVRRHLERERPGDRVAGSTVRGRAPGPAANGRATP